MLTCDFFVQLAAKEDEIKRLLDELSNQLNEYQALMDTKVALDMEIAVFRRLLESEEDRLGINIGGSYIPNDVGCNILLSTYTVKNVCEFPYPAGMLITKLSLVGNN